MKIIMYFLAIIVTAFNINDFANGTISLGAYVLDIAYYITLGWLICADIQNLIKKYES